MANSDDKNTSEDNGYHKLQTPDYGAHRPRAPVKVRHCKGVPSGVRELSVRTQWREESIYFNEF